MAIQDQSDGTGAVSSVRDAASFSRSSARCDLVLGSIATNSSVDEQIPKVRKPYTITKKRERWTDEEHEKFLEALKLYGRSWRQIEEYVGTKTAVQIRSHAQKFFSKVGRGSSNGGTESSIKPIEIPPPRPKRKPSHPYPRKFTGTLEGTSAERGRQSPTSVLSAGSSGSALTEQLGGCHSPLSCTTDMHSNSSVPAEKENECMTSDLYQKGKEPFPFLQLNTTSGQDNMSLKKFKESEDTDGKVTKNASSGNIRLFGTIFTAPNSEEHSGTEKSVSLSLKLGQEGLQTVQSVDSELALARANSNLKPVPCVAPPVHPMEVDGNSNQPGANYISPFQKWPLYQGLGNIHHSIFTGTAETPFCSPAEQNLKESDIAKEVSSTGSNSGSVDEAENEKNVDAADSNSQLGCGQEKFSTFKSTKGFVPYKRSLSERDMDSSKIDSDKTKGQRPRVCL